MSLIHEELSGKITGAAMQVLNTLRPGLDEKIYGNALVLELKASGHVVEQQRQFPVIYREVNVGTLIPDLIVDGAVIVDPKVVSSFSDTHTAQMTGYLAITGLNLASLINFKNATLKSKRIVSRTQGTFNPRLSKNFDRGLC
jgi:GxxExxY protein